MIGFVRSKRFWKRTVIVLALVVAVLLITNSIFAWLAERRVDTRIEEIRKRGEPASIADLAPLAIPEDRNAAAILQRANPRIEAFANEQGRFFDTPIGKAYDEATDRGEPAMPEQIEALREILAKYPDVDAALVEAAACDEYASQLDYSLRGSEFVESIIDRQAEIRQAARYLVWKTEVLLADGQTTEAVENSLRILRLARLYDEPSLVGFLIRIAVRTYGINGLYDGLASGDVSPELHDAIDQELARHDTQETLVAALNSERALSTGWLESTAMQQHYPWLFRVFGWQLKWYQAGSLDALAEYIHLAGQPWHEVRQQVGDSRSTVTETGHGILADLLVPAMRASFHANARSRAMVRSLRIYNELRRYAEEHGKEAEGLSDLSLPQEATIDPYSGEPLKLKRGEAGWVVYSVMENGADDGGDFRDQKDYGVAPRKWRSVD